MKSRKKTAHKEYSLKHSPSHIYFQPVCNPSYFPPYILSEMNYNVSKHLTIRVRHKNIYLNTANWKCCPDFCFHTNSYLSSFVRNEILGEDSSGQIERHAVLNHVLTSYVYHKGNIRRHFWTTDNCTVTHTALQLAAQASSVLQREYTAQVKGDTLVNP